MATKRKRSNTVKSAAAKPAATSKPVGAATASTSTTPASPSSATAPLSRSPSPTLAPAECPFTVIYRQLPRPKRARPSTTSIIAAAPADDTVFDIEPKKQWDSLKKYRHFVVGQENFGVDDFVFINHLPIPAGAEVPAGDESNFWIARVLEIRAVDEAHVYLRVYWWYWPEELPMGRCDWHGKKELVASNHMEIVDAMTVSGRADVRRWEELDEEEEVGELFWRQKLDYPSGKLMPVREHCACKKYYNPDTIMLHCQHCKTWLHHHCIVTDVQNRFVAGAPAPTTTPPTKRKSLVSSATDGAKNTEVEPPKLSKAERANLEVQLVVEEGKQPEARVRDLRGTKAKRGRKPKGGAAAEEEDEAPTPIEKVLEVQCLCCHEVIS